jgi:hypothetical protein
VRSACQIAIRLATTPPASITAKVTAVSCGRNARLRGKPGVTASRSPYASAKLASVSAIDCSRIIRTITQFDAPISLSVAIDLIFSIVST